MFLASSHRTHRKSPRSLRMTLANSSASSVGGAQSAEWTLERVGGRWLASCDIQVVTSRLDINGVYFLTHIDEPF